MRLVRTLVLAGAMAGCSPFAESGASSVGHFDAPVLAVRRHYTYSASNDVLRASAERAFASSGVIVRPRGRLILVRPSEDRGVTVVLFVQDSVLTVVGRVFPSARPNGSARMARLLAVVGSLPGVGVAPGRPPSATPAPPSALSAPPPHPPAALEPLRPLRPRSRH